MLETEAQVNAEVQISINSRQSSYNTNRKITEVYSSKTLLGKRCFIIGGGPSVSKYNLRKLESEFVISVNGGFIQYDKAQINYFNDITFYNNIVLGNYNEKCGFDADSKWKILSGIKTTVAPFSNSNFPELYLIKRQPIFRVSKEISNGIFPGTNSGFGAIMLAIALGCEEILLVGFDFKTEGSRTHFHKAYGHRDHNDFNATLQSYADELDCAKFAFDDNGIRIYNLSNDSILSKYDFRNFNKEVGIV